MTTAEPTVHEISDTKKMVAFADKESAVDAAAQHFVDVAQSAIRKRGKFTVALSGGSTPEAIFRKLTADQVDWSKVLLFWSDERSVPPNHKDSNYRMAMDAGLKKLVPEESIFRMQAESDIEVHAAAYDHLIQTKCDGSFDLMMLGMGPDGHTASLFPESEALKVKDKLVTPNYVEKFDTWRMTCTYPCINASKKIVVYVLGESKRDMLTQVLKGPEKFPIQMVGTANTPAVYLTDIAL